MSTHENRIDLNGVMSLLSTNIYSIPETFLREYIQNGLDACEARRVYDPLFEGTVNVSLCQIGGDHFCRFSDNGVGMNEDEIRQFVAAIASSSKRNTDGIHYRGMFGIGMLSAFVHTSEIIIVTKSCRQNNALTYEWRGSRNGTFQIRTVEDRGECGTDAYLRIDQKNHLFEPRNLIAKARWFGCHAIDEVIVCGEKLHSVQAPWLNPLGVGLTEWCSFIEEQLPGMRVSEESLLEINLSPDFTGVFVLTTEKVSMSALQSYSHLFFCQGLRIDRSIEHFLPEWARPFGIIVGNSRHLSPTISRESFKEDSREIKAIRVKIDQVLKVGIVNSFLAGHGISELLIHFHNESLMYLAAMGDDEIYRVAGRGFRLHTNQGVLTLGEILDTYSTIYLADSVESFKRFAPTAKQQNLLMIGGYYLYYARLINYLYILDETIEIIDVSPWSGHFADCTSVYREEADPRSTHLYSQTQSALRPYRCRPDFVRQTPTHAIAFYDDRHRNISGTIDRDYTQLTLNLDSDTVRELDRIPAPDEWFEYLFFTARRTMCSKRIDTEENKIQQIQIALIKRSNGEEVLS